MAAEAGKHGYVKSTTDPDHWITFSVGVFQWVLKKDGKGVKKSKVLVRVRGLTANPDAVYKQADRVVLELNVGTYRGPRLIDVS